VEVRRGVPVGISEVEVDGDAEELSDAGHGGQS
jgi:hypothetical protein